MNPIQTLKCYTATYVKGADTLATQLVKGYITTQIKHVVHLPKCKQRGTDLSGDTII